MAKWDSTGLFPKGTAANPGSHTCGEKSAVRAPCIERASEPPPAQFEVTVLLAINSEMLVV